MASSCSDSLLMLLAAGFTLPGMLTRVWVSSPPFPPLLFLLFIAANVFFVHKRKAESRIKWQTAASPFGVLRRQTNDKTRRQARREGLLGEKQAVGKAAAQTEAF